ncbi:MAG: acyl-CoA dehydrogenase family protein [Rhodobacteraceae bacterium]|nr:acyl-CoA dehydrogenase family protein [Paracoccaceae bacterium]
MPEFRLPSELVLFRDMLRSFVDRELIPVEHLVQPNGEIPPELHAGLAAKARAAGLWLLDVPEAYGGQALDLLAMAVFWEEISRTITVPCRDYTIFGPAIGPILLNLNDDQKHRYLLPVIRGEKVACFAQTEPDAGSDPASMRTRAVRGPDGYVLNGTKRFITNAHRSHFAQVMAVTDPGKGAKGISCLLVDLDSPGVRVRSSQQTMMGERPSEIYFDDVHVPYENLVGREGEGFALAQDWINHGRIRHGARGCGVATRCLELAVSYSRQRKTFGAPLSERQGIQWMLADCFIELHAARLMVHDAAARLDAGRDARSETFMVKIFGDEMSFRVADKCLAIHGGIGLTTDLPIERFWRDQRSFIITEGPPEVLRTALARNIFRHFN